MFCREICPADAAVVAGACPDVSALKKTHSRVLLLPVDVLVPRLQVALQFPFPFLVTHQQVHPAALPESRRACRHAVAGAPATRIARLLRVVHIVEVPEERQTRLVRKTQAEHLAHESVMRPVAALGVGNPSRGILTFQVHVHHQRILALLLRTAPQVSVGGLLLVHLHLVHHIGRQVFERNSRVALEEVLTVDQQVAHEFPVHGDAAAVLYLHARQLFHQSVEHRSFRQLEGIGVVDQRVVLHHHHHLRGLHHGLFQLISLLQQDCSRPNAIFPATSLHGDRHCLLFISFLAETQYHGRYSSSHLDYSISNHWKITRPIRIISRTLHRIKDFLHLSCPAQHFNFHLRQRLTGKIVIHTARNLKTVIYHNARISLGLKKQQAKYDI